MRKDDHCVAFHTRNALRRFGYAALHPKAATCQRCRRTLLDGESVHWICTKSGRGWFGGRCRQFGYVCADCRGDVGGDQRNAWTARPCHQCARMCYRPRNDWRTDSFHFCSDLCYGIHYRAPKLKAAAGERRKECTTCGAVFDASRRDAETCSSACRQKAYRQRRRSEGGES